MEWLPCVHCLEFVDRRDQVARKIEEGLTIVCKVKFYGFSLMEACGYNVFARVQKQEYFLGL